MRWKKESRIKQNLSSYAIQIIPPLPCCLLTTYLDFCSTISDKVTLFSDEAYYDFIEEKSYPSMVCLVRKGKNIIVSKTFSKVYGLAGLHIGYLMAKPKVAINLRKNIMAFTNVLAIKAAKNAIDDQEFYNLSLNKTFDAKKIIMEGLKTSI
jgi:histidinol-phosphate aminotransferase